MSTEPNENHPSPEPIGQTDTSAASTDEAFSADARVVNADDNASAEEQLAAVTAERDELNDKWLRAEAETENVRKRLRRELDEAREFQSLALIRDLLPALDNLQRAVVAAESSKNVDEMLQGISMVIQQFDDTLSRHSAKPIETAGQPFDPNLHEALQQVPSPDHEPMTVIQEVQRGYIMKERVVRPSQVIVAVAPPTSD